MSDRRLFRTAAPGLKSPGRVGRIRAWWGGWPLGQLAFLGVLALLGWLFVSNVLETMARVGILPGFGFLASSANFEIGESAIPFRAGDTYLRAIAAGRPWRPKRSRARSPSSRCTVLSRWSFAAPNSPRATSTAPR